MDELTRKIWLYLLKERGELFSVFVKLRTLVERQTDLKLKILIIDCGGKYNFREFNEFYAAKSIEHEVSTPHTPQHNDLVKREIGP